MSKKNLKRALESCNRLYYGKSEFDCLVSAYQRYGKADQSDLLAFLHTIKTFGNVPYCRDRTDRLEDEIIKLRRESDEEEILREGGFTDKQGFPAQ